MSVKILRLLCAILLVLPSVVYATSGSDTPVASLYASEEEYVAPSAGILSQIKDMTAESIDGGTMLSRLRPTTLRNTAETIAIQTAVKWQYEQFLAVLEDADYELSKIFDFAPLMLHDGKVLPPVLTVSDGGMEIKDDTLAVSSEVTFEIVQPARITMVKPNWRDYLWREYEVVNSVTNAGLLPQDSEEKLIWDKAVEAGWKTGIEQANRLFITAMNRLRRDYRGIILFHRLSKQGIVTVPMLAEDRVAMQVNGKTLDLDQRVFHLTMTNEFETDMKNWKPRAAKTEGPE